MAHLYPRSRSGKNKAYILHLANEKYLGKVEFMHEKVAGKVSWKQRKIEQVLEDLNKGDVILLSEFSHLGRSMLECMEIISIAMQKGIRIYTVKGNWQLDDSIQSKVMVVIPTGSCPTGLRHAGSRQTGQCCQVKKTCNFVAYKAKRK